MKGGYKLIDFKNINIPLGDNGVTINGIYEQIENSYRKPFILTGLVINGIEKNDVFGPIVNYGSDFITSVVYIDSGSDTQYRLLIRQDDKVEVNNI